MDDTPEKPFRHPEHQGPDCDYLYEDQPVHKVPATCPTCGQKEPVPPPRDHCVSCGIELPLNTVGTRNYDNALIIGFYGGYGMFIDPPLGEIEVYLCHDCAHQACEALPWMHKVLDPKSSHAHPAAWWAEHPDHEGWDKP